MRRQKLLYILLILIGILSSCSRQEVASSYQNGHLLYVNGEFSRSVPFYLKCVSHSRFSDCDIAAYAYSEMAIICHMEGNNKMAYDINERSVDMFKRAGLTRDYHYALCRSAIYNARLGNCDEAIAQLRYVKALSFDTIIQNMTDSYIQLLLSNQFPLLDEANVKYKYNASELYNAVEVMKYELYRKPLFIKIIISALLFLLTSFGIYLAHSGTLSHLNELRNEKKVYNQQFRDDIMQYCSYLQSNAKLMKDELQWGNYQKMCTVVNMKMGGLINKISKTVTLNETEIRLCVLVFIGLQRNVIAEILPYASNSVGKLKNTVSKKLQTNGKNMQKTLHEMVFNHVK